MNRPRTSPAPWAVCVVIVLPSWVGAKAHAADAPVADAAGEYVAHVRPLMAQYCLRCHSQKEKKGDLDLERFGALRDVRQDLRPWQEVLEKLDGAEMPPKKAPQPTPEERQRLVGWVRGLLTEEARARAGDPGRVVVRRLSNAEYDYTVRDLTGVDLRPTRDFPADGAAGEGFTNAGDALVMSPTLLAKYLKAAKGVAAHAVLLPDGLRFSPSTARRDWTDETLARLRKTYHELNHGPDDGRLDFAPYLTAAVAHRDDLLSGKTTIDVVAAKEKLGPKYLRVLWQALSDPAPSFPLDAIRARWRQASPKDVGATAALIRAWQALLWKYTKIGSYMNPVWQDADKPPLVDVQTIRFRPPPPAAGKGEVVLYLAVRDLTGVGDAHVVWRRPRLEGGKQPPLLLRDAAGSGGLDKSRFDANGDAPAVAPSVIEVRLPAELCRDREFVAEGELAPGDGKRLVQFEVRADAPDLAKPVGGAACVAGADLRGDPKKREEGFDAFRRCFPAYLFHGKIVPDDEIINLRLFFREDEPLARLFLDDGQKQELDRLWRELTYVSQEYQVEDRNYPSFCGFVSQDGKEALKKFQDRTAEGVRRRAEDFQKESEAAEPKHLDALLDFAARAYRRPLEDQEKADLLALYHKLRTKEMSHDEAFRTVLTRVLVAPAFLYRVERPADGPEDRPVSAWEQATRLSYFLWATLPDAELRDAAAGGRLAEPAGLSAQAARMLKDGRVRGLAVEFAAQWLQVRDFLNNHEKNPKLFPAFDDKLRAAMFEETVLYFEDLFQNDRSVLEILDSDHTFLDETLAKHYGIPNVSGPEWRRVDGVKQYGRGGVLGMGSVLATESGASRTSPVLRGNWLVETLLGEKIPRPPPDVPKIPDDETATENLTVRQLVQRHTRVPECAVCHQRIDPFGFALEKYDPIGRFRDKDLGGRPVDCRATLRDGTQFDGVDGLRNYLLTQRKEDFLRHFCTKLLGYALGRSVTLSDQPLVDDMVAGLKANDYRISAAIQTVVSSRQFRRHRPRDAAGDQGS